MNEQSEPEPLIWATDGRTGRREVRRGREVVAAYEPVRSVRPQGPWLRVSGVDGLEGLTVHLRTAVREGRLVCTGLLLEAEDGELTARDLRRLRLGDLVYMTGPEPLAAPWQPYTGPSLPRRTMPGRIPREALEEVAAEYRRLVAEGVKNPARRIAEERHYSPETIRRWIVLARGEGLLGRALRGKAGEASAPKKAARTKRGKR